MNIYMWNEPKLGLSGVTCAKYKDDAKRQVIDYLRNKFLWQSYEDFELEVWPITELDSYDTKHPMTIVTNYYVGG